jgi:nickel-type superoxide dismutase maturation protease
MQPTVNPGDRVLAQVGPGKPPQAGDIVIVRHPFRPSLLLIKRVQEVFCDGGFYLISDNLAEPTAQDSRSFGIVGPDLILGRVTSIFWQRP